MCDCVYNLWTKMYWKFRLNPISAGILATEGQRCFDFILGEKRIGTYYYFYFLLYKKRGDKVIMQYLINKSDSKFWLNPSLKKTFSFLEFFFFLPHPKLGYSKKKKSVKKNHPHKKDIFPKQNFFFLIKST